MSPETKLHGVYPYLVSPWTTPAESTGRCWPGWWNT